MNELKVYNDHSNKKKPHGRLLYINPKGKKDGIKKMTPPRNLTREEVYEILNIP